MREMSLPASARSEAWQLYQKYHNEVLPSEEQAALAECALQYLIETDTDDFDRKINQYNLAALYFQQEEYDLALEQFESILAENPGDTMALAGAADCCFTPNTDCFDEDKAWNYYAGVFKRDKLRGAVGMIHILCEGSAARRDLDAAWDLLNSVWDLAVSNIKFVHKQFPELVAVRVWFGLNGLKPCSDFFELESLIQQALQIMRKRTASQPQLHSSVVCRRVLFNLLIQWEEMLDAGEFW